MILTKAVILFWVTIFVLLLVAIFSIGLFLKKLPETVGGIFCFWGMFFLSLGLLLWRIITIPPDVTVYYKEEEYDLEGLSMAVHAKVQVSTIVKECYIMNEQNFLTGKDRWVYVIPYDVLPIKSKIAEQYKK